MAAADGTQIGWGVAAAGCYPSMMPPAIATLRIGANGGTRFSTSGHEMGQGIRTAIAAVLLEGLDITADRLEIVIGDTTAAPQHMTAGSWGTAGAIPVAAKAVEHMRSAVSTAASQIRGGVVRAFSAALREATEIDPRFGGYLNNDLADYVVAANADIGDIDVGFIDRSDPLANSIGLKGLGEVATVGASAAIANAIFHATGKRLREPPIRVEHLL
jgi:CO/xanthine dehydrogenase Mo-binding subunit